MFNIYHFCPLDFKDESNSEFLYIMNFIKNTEIDKEYTFDNFQEIVENIRFSLVKFDFNLAKTVQHYKRKPFNNDKFIEMYNKHLNDLKSNNLELLKKEDIIECYSLYESYLGEEFCNEIFAIAKTENGYLAFEYSFTA